MTRSFRLAVAPALVAALLLTTGAVAPGASAASTRHAAAARMDRVVLHITSTGSTVWGAVNARYTRGRTSHQRSCSAATCTLHIPQGVTLHLSQTAADVATWPFQDWKITTAHHTRSMTAGSIHVKVTGATVVRAVYVLAQSGSSYGGNDGYSP